MITHTEQVLTLAQWLSPSYPVGSFAYSHGLEWAIQTGDVSDADGLEAWVKSVLLHGAGKSDALLLAAAYRADDPLCVDATARAFAASAERLKETALQGEAFSRATRDIWDTPISGLTYPVAVGHAAKLNVLPLELTIQMFLHAFVANLAAVGMRLIPLGQTEGHKVIKALTPLCIAISQDAVQSTLDDLSSTSFMADIASMKHETQYSRIFRT